MHSSLVIGQKKQLTACCIFLTNHTVQYKLTASFWQFRILKRWNWSCRCFD